MNEWNVFIRMKCPGISIWSTSIDISIDILFCIFVCVYINLYHISGYGYGYQVYIKSAIFPSVNVSRGYIFSMKKYLFLWPKLKTHPTNSNSNMCYYVLADGWVFGGVCVWVCNIYIYTHFGHLLDVCVCEKDCLIHWKFQIKANKNQSILEPLTNAI